MEADQGAAAVLDRAGVLELGGGLAAGIFLAPQHAVARDLDLELIGEGVDDRAADAMQPARGRVSLAAELAARVQRREDHFERAQVLEFRVRIDRDAAAIVAHAQPVAGLERHLDRAGVAGDRLVHRVVEHLGGEMVQRGLVGAADIHAGPAPHGLEAFEHLDIPCGVSLITPAITERGQQIVHAVFPSSRRKLIAPGRTGKRFGRSTAACRRAPAGAPRGTTTACRGRATPR